MADTKYQELQEAFWAAQDRWFEEQKACTESLQRCRDAWARYYGCSADRIQLVKVAEDHEGRVAVNPFLEFDEKARCWRFTLRVQLGERGELQRQLNFRTEFRLRLIEGGFEIAAGEPQPWHEVHDVTAAELGKLFDSINDWMLRFFSDGYTGSDHAEVIGFQDRN